MKCFFLPTVPQKEGIAEPGHKITTKVSVMMSQLLVVACQVDSGVQVEEAVPTDQEL